MQLPSRDKAACDTKGSYSKGKEEQEKNAVSSAAKGKSRERVIPRGKARPHPVDQADPGEAAARGGVK